VNYRLVLLTHGASLEPATATLASAADQLDPAPAEVLVVRDGPGPSLRDVVRACWPGVALFEREGRRSGFCATTRRAWRLSAEPGPSWVYWLEHDFLHLRPVALEQLAEAMRRWPRIAQVSLPRGPANEAECAAGGYRELYPDSYRPGPGHWIETERNWTTNPHLRRRDLAAAYDWPAEPRCEGLFGFRLRAERPGTTFAIWGAGEQWVEHVGERSGYGY
jgi:hypothetical protein